MNDTKLPTDYESKFDYDIPSYAAVMEVVQQIPDKAWGQILTDQWWMFYWGIHPENGKYDGTDNERTQKWEKDHEVEYNHLTVAIPEAFEKVLRPFPEDFDEIIKKLKKLRGKFGIDDDHLKDTQFADIISAKDLLQDWEGTFADGAVNYLTNLSTIVSNHGKVAKALEYNMEANKAIYAQARVSAKTIADETMTALDYFYANGIGPKVPTHNPFDDTTLAYAIAVGTVASVAGGPIGLAAALIAGVATVGAATNDDSTGGKSITLDGITGQATVGLMFEAIGTLEEQIKDQEKAVIKGFREGVADRIVDIVNKDFNAKSPDDSDLLPMAIDADPNKLYQEDKGGE